VIEISLLELLGLVEVGLVLVSSVFSSFEAGLAELLARLIPYRMTPPKRTPMITARITSLRIVFRNKG